MENFENQEQNENAFICSNEINNYLIETSKWGKFLAIVGFVGMGILILIGIIMMFVSSAISSLSGSQLPIGVIALIYVVIGAIYFFPLKYLFSFSVNLKQGLTSNDERTITSGFQNLKSLFKFMGIFTIVVLSLYVLILLIAIPSMLFFMHG